MDWTDLQQEMTGEEFLNWIQPKPMASEWHFSKAGHSKGNSCKYCEGFTGTIARVFGSFDEFQRSEFYGGGDVVVHDKHASVAIWPGKNNVGRPPSDFWICTPLHPWCSCSWLDELPPGVEENKDDWYSRLTDEQIKDLTTER